MRKVIILVGRARSGKDFTADIICRNVPGCNRIAYADALKRGLAEMTGIPLPLFYDQNWKLRDLAEYGLPGKTIRWLLQTVGTDYFRNGINELFWVNTVANKINQSPKDALWVVTDCRFKNELELEKLLKNAKCCKIKLIRNSIVDDTPMHASEAEIDSLPTDFMIFNDSTVEELEKSVTQFTDLMFGK